MDATAEKTAPRLDDEAFTALLDVQSGVVSRRQILELGGHDWDIRRLVRARDLAVVHAGVFANHTGPLTGLQRQWAAVLVHWPAALTRESALPGHVDDAIVHVAIRHQRTVRRLAGIEVHRTSEIDSRVRWNLSPPAMRIEEAALDVAANQPDLLGRFEVLASVCRKRHTRPERLVDALGGRRWYRDRAILLEMLADLAAGACSVLEREYLALERRHGLPVADRQSADRVTKGRIYRDADYTEFGLVVELVGRAYHDDIGTWEDDHERDLDTSVDQEAVTLRLTYGQVFRHGCRTVAKVAALLQRRGWTGELVRCPTCPGETCVISSQDPAAIPTPQSDGSLPS